MRPTKLKTVIAWACVTTVTIITGSTLVAFFKKKGIIKNVRPNTYQLKSEDGSLTDEFTCSDDLKDGVEYEIWINFVFKVGALNQSDLSFICQGRAASKS